MSPTPLLAQLELTLRQLLHEHGALLRQLEEHEAAVRSCSLERIERSTRDADAVRQRIGHVESRRRVLMHQVARQQRNAPSPLTLAALAEIYPDRKAAFVQMRAELSHLVGQIQQRSALIGRVAQSVLGHVNATLRLVAQATAGPGAYTRAGNAPISGRLGVLNAVA